MVEKPGKVYRKNLVVLEVAKVIAKSFLYDDIYSPDEDLAI